MNTKPNSKDPQALIAKIDALLPQTQCELCEHPGCLPYAKAIVTAGERIDRCLPGGVETLNAIAEYLDIDASNMRAELAAKSKTSSKVFIDESRCIGCAKCLPVCPTDAIIGSGKRMHTVIANACTGCDRCIPACPVDCIISIDAEASTEQERNNWRERFNTHQARLQKLADKKRKQHLANKQQGNHAEQHSARKARLAQLMAMHQKKIPPGEL